VFETINDVTYQVKFKPTPYLFAEQPGLGSYIFELIVAPVNSTVNRTGTDAQIPATVAAICEDFVQNRERILLYICETADSRHMARVRKFDAWFREFNDFHFIKLDANFPDVNNITYYASLIFRLDHPQRHLILDEFELLAKRYNTDK
jgi:hypothetical protein